MHRERESFLDEYSERNKISTNLSIPLNSYSGGRKICTGHDYVSDWSWKTVDKWSTKNEWSFKDHNLCLNQA